MQNISFLGLGVMGGGMAMRLVDAGPSHNVTVWNRRREKAEPLALKGARVAATPRDAGTGANVVVSMVADDTASQSVWLGPDGALAGMMAGSIAIESSTLSPGWIRELGAAAAERGCALVDAPVTGSKVQAAGGQLLFLVGGSADTFARVKDILALMGRDAIHVGPLGSGARLKLVNNFMCGVQAAAIAEAITVIERSGLDRDAALKVLAAGAPGSPLVGAVAPRMAQSNFAVNFALTLMQKDLNYAISEAAEHGVSLTTAIAARQHFDRAVIDGLGDADFSAIVEPLRKL